MLPALAIWLALLPAQSAASAPQAVPASQAEAALPSDPDSLEPYHGPKPVAEPKLINHIDPQFTKEEMKQSMSGVLVISLIIDTHGNPRNVHIQRSLVESLSKKHRDEKHIENALAVDQTAMDAVRQYKFMPATVEGTPVTYELKVEVQVQY
jgi:outer membrane biosynthesis protein TonB